MVGRKRLYELGLAGQLFGALLCGFSADLGQLVGFRVVQAIGAAMVTANSIALVLELYPPSRRGFLVGIWEAGIGVGLGVGPVLGGLLLAAFDWPSIFFTQALASAMLLALCLRYLPEPPRPNRPHQSFDFAGAALFATALAPLMFALTKGPELGWVSGPIVLSFVVSVTSMFLFVAVERRIRHPMMDLSLFQRRGFSAGNLAKVFGYFGFGATQFLLPFYLVQVLELPATQMGFVLTGLPVGMVVGSAVSGPLSDRIGTRWLGAGGLLLVALSALVQTQVTTEAGVLPVLVGSRDSRPAASGRLSPRMTAPFCQLRRATSSASRTA